MPKVHAIPAFRDNYIWLLAGDDGVCAIVDPGDAAPVLEALRRLKLTPAAILVTHQDADHVAGIAALLEHYPLPVHGPDKDSIPGLTHPAREGDRLILAPSLPALTVMETPGHTPGHIVYHNENTLFCGDVLFGGGCGKVRGGRVAQMHHSLQRLSSLPGNMWIYCAHEYTLSNLRFAREVEPGNHALAQREREVEMLRARRQATIPARLEVERNTNPFLRCHIPEVIAAAERHAGRPLAGPAQVFSVLRYWRDTWTGK